MSDWSTMVIQILNDYGYIIVFFGTMIAGEIVILPSVFLASLSVLNIYVVVLLCLMGIMISDNLWYFIGRKFKTKLSYLGRYFYHYKYQKRVTVFGEKFIDHYKKYLVMSKFIYGFRIITLLTAGYQKIPYKKFITYNLIGTISELALIVFLGYTMGWSFAYLSRYSGYTKYLVVFGLLILFMLRYGFRRLMDYSNHYGQ